MDIASLGIKVINEGITQAVKALDQLKGAAKETESANGDLSASAKQADAAIKGEGDSARASAGLLRQLSDSGGDAARVQGALAREANQSSTSQSKAAAAAEKYASSLQREADQIGKTTRQIKLLEIEANALAAESAGLNEHAARIRGIGAAWEDSGKKIGVASHDVKNMSYQIVDVVQGLLTGQKPLMVFMQQGGQIGQVAATSGAGIGEWAAALGLLNPLLWAAVAVVGVAAGAFLLFKSDVNKAADNKDFVKSLGLSKKELKELGNTSVTAGDILKGLWATIDKGGRVSDVFKQIADVAVSGFRFFLNGIEWAIAGVYAAEKALLNVWLGVNQVMAGDMSGFDKIRHSFDNIKADAIGAKNGMDGFWKSVSDNAVAASHDRLRKKAEDIKGEKDSGVDALLSKVQELERAIRPPEETIFGKMQDQVSVLNEALAKGVINLARYTADLAGVRKFAHDAALGKDQTPDEKAYDKYTSDVGGLNKLLDAGVLSADEYTKALQNAKAEMLRGQEIKITDPKLMDFKDLGLGKNDDLSTKIIDTTKDMEALTISLTPLQKGISSIGDAFESAFERAGRKWKDFGDFFAQELQSMIMKAASADLANLIFGAKNDDGNRSGGLIGTALNWLSSFKANANGGVYSSPSLSAYSGQVRDTPTVFAFANGAGVFGEAGPEAIMPLSRGGDGKLGVKVTGTKSPSNSSGGAMDVRVYVDQDGNWQAKVENIAGNVSAKVTRSGLEQYDAAMPQRVANIQADPRVRR